MAIFLSVLSGARVHLVMLSSVDDNPTNKGIEYESLVWNT